MKIAIFSDTFFPQINGVAGVVSQSALGLKNLGHEVKVFTVSKNSGKELEIISVPSLPFYGYGGERFTLPFGWTLKALIKFKPDIIHSHTPFALGWEAVLAAKITKTPLVGTHHTFFDHYLKHVKLDYFWAKKFSWRYVSAYYNFCDLILSPSRSLAETMKQCGLKTNIEIMPNPIDTDLFRPKDPAARPTGSIVYMGRLSYEKNIDQAIKAAALLVKKIPAVKFTIIGSGPEKTKLEKLAENLGLKNNVVFSGGLYGKNLAETLAANRIFLTASKSENLPLSVLEAMSAGLPVIGVNALGMPEIIHDGVNGFIAEKDNPKELSEKVFELLNDGDLLRRFSSAARESALNYSQEKVAELLVCAYLKCKIKK